MKSLLKLSVSVEVIDTCQFCSGFVGFEPERISVEVNIVAAVMESVIVIAIANETAEIIFITIMFTSAVFPHFNNHR